MICAFLAWSLTMYLLAKSTWRSPSMSSIVLFFVIWMGQRGSVDSDHFGRQLAGNWYRRKVMTPFGTRQRRIQSQSTSISYSSYSSQWYVESSEKHISISPVSMEFRLDDRLEITCNRTMNRDGEALFDRKSLRVEIWILKIFVFAAHFLIESSRKETEECTG